MKEVHISKAWPFAIHCRLCCPKKKPSFKLALKKSLLNKLDMKIPKSDIAIENDPFLLLGYGMNSYFEIIK